MKFLNKVDNLKLRSNEKKEIENTMLVAQCVQIAFAVKEPYLVLVLVFSLVLAHAMFI